MRYRPVTLALIFVVPFCVVAEEPTWFEIDGVVYGAKADEQRPIGGGTGYENIVVTGDYIVKDLDALLDALSKAKAGQTVFIPDQTEIDLTARIYIEQLVLEVPEGAIAKTAPTSRERRLKSIITRFALRRLLL